MNARHYARYLYERQPAMTLAGWPYPPIALAVYEREAGVASDEMEAQADDRAEQDAQAWTTEYDEETGRTVWMRGGDR